MADMRAHQSGQAILLTVLLLAVGVAAVIYTLAGPNRERIKQDEVTAAELAEAQTALIGFAAAHPSRPGALPCPDINNDGLSDPDAAGTGPCTSTVGRLPYRTLGIGALRDGAGELLWYAVSPNFIDAAASTPLNSHSPGNLQLSVSGAPPLNNIVAMIVAPGGVLGTQVRGTGADMVAVSNYLEGTNATSPTSFESRRADTSFNDHVLPITGDLLFSLVARRVAKEVVLALEAYRSATGYLPRASSFANANCNGNLTQGRLPLNLTTCNSSQTSLNILGIEIVIGSTPMAAWNAVPALVPWYAWYSTNQWNTVTYYAVSDGCSAPVRGLAALLAGLLSARTADCRTLDLLGLGNILGILGLLGPGQPEAPVTVSTASTNALAVAIVSGRKLGGAPPCASAAECFQDTADTENADGDKEFARPPRYPASNDRMAVLCPAGSVCQQTNCPSAPAVPCAFAH